MPAAKGKRKALAANSQVSKKSRVTSPSPNLKTITAAYLPSSRDELELSGQGNPRRKIAKSTMYQEEDLEDEYNEVLWEGGNRFS